MFVIACKESGCVKLIGTQDPRNVMELSPTLSEHFDVLEFNDNNDYTGKFLKVIDNQIVDLGFIKDLESTGNTALMNCNDCPPIV